MFQLMRKNIDPSEELTVKDFKGADIEFTSNPADLNNKEKQNGSSKGM